MRTTARRLALPAAALAAALALTACQSSDQDAAAPAPAKPGTTAPATTAPATATPESTASAPAAPAPSSSPATEAARKTTEPPAKPSPKAPTDSTAGSGSAGSGSTGSDSGSAGNTPLRPCTAADVKVVASKVSRPINHLALTITNTGGRVCHAPDAPLVGFDHSQAPIRIVEESKPQAVVTLTPGESAYASLILTGEPAGPGEDTHGTTVRTIKVNLTADSMVTVAAPSGTYVDDGAAVSYWQRELEDALQY
ncbi:DUF4232 domain-containing protein [Streptomyces sp. NPDC035033]|uniref:DUF4232 domain-containing protein n=1 Tax=Streptomyces sp. NPDC035033 TaxID=3155368 RepID=UPI0033DDB3EF